MALCGSFPASFQDAMRLRRGFQPQCGWLISGCPFGTKSSGGWRFEFVPHRDCSLFNYWPTKSTVKFSWWKMCAITNKQNSPVVKYVSEKQIKARINMLFVNE